MAKIKQKDAVDMFLAGESVLLVEYRSSAAETIKWRDKESRATLSAPMLRHVCESAKGAAYIINERVDEKTFDPLTYKQTELVKGQKALLTYSTSTVEKGIRHFAGVLTPVEP